MCTTSPSLLYSTAAAFVNTQSTYWSVTAVAYNLSLETLVLVSQEQEDEAELWKDLKALQPEDVLPYNMPDLFYTRMQMLIKCSQFADRISPFLQEFPIDR